MKVNTIGRSLVSASVMCLVLSFLPSCSDKDEPDRQKAVNMLTIRTVGLAYLEENKLNEAEEQFKKLIEMAPEEVLGYANLGLVYMRMGRYQDAEKQLNKALELEPASPDIRVNLATIYEQDDRLDQAVALLEQNVKESPEHVQSLYKLSQFYKRDAPPRFREAEELLQRIVNQQAANVAARLELIEVLLRNGKADEARANLEALRQQLPELPKESLNFFEAAIEKTADGKADEALQPAIIFSNFMKATPAYQGSITQLTGSGGPLQGTPLLTFSKDISLDLIASESILEALHFTDATDGAGLNVVSAVSDAQTVSTLTVADFDNDGDQDVFASLWHGQTRAGRTFLFMNDFGAFTDIAEYAGTAHPGQEAISLFADYDNDGFLDLFLANRTQNRLYRNIDVGKFADLSRNTGLDKPSLANACRFADFDHDGDLDIFLANNGPNELYRNDGDGTFTEMAEAMGLAGAAIPSRDAGIGDFDEDGDLDLFVVNENGHHSLLMNQRQGRFEDTASSSGLVSTGRAGAGAVGDYNNDGFLDLLVAGIDADAYALFRNKGDGTFEQEAMARDALASLAHLESRAAHFLDFDNDGFLDIAVGGSSKNETGPALQLLHNEGRGAFRNTSNLLPEALPAVNQIAVADYNEDGDLDLFVGELHGGIRLLRNDGGNANKYLKVRLRGLRKGSGKNNYFGIGSKLEVRAGDLYQIRVITDPVTHFGLAQKLKADVVRILWPNGVAQNLFYPGSDQDLVEEQALKGSCAFVYGWNGEAYEFITDVMWRSALGMPLGIMGGETAYAFANSSNDYFRIPGEKLKEQSGIYRMQVTEELWETAYFDKVRLFAIDHPDSVAIYIDERFVPPPVPPLKVFAVRDERVPVSAHDERGNDLLDLLRQQDHRYVANLIPANYQGITQLHDLVLDLGDVQGGKSITMFLQGWIYPTDASINVAAAQSEAVQVVPPMVQVLDRAGNWQTVVENLSFPTGKNKTVIADLSGKFLSETYKVRIRTTMEIYWDRVFFTAGQPDVPIVHTEMEPVAADLHYRGFSGLYQKGGRYGPHWFDYQNVSKEQKWRDLIGHYTRYGDVLPLLLESDSKFIIMNAGDEVTLDFAVADAPALPEGWSRDFLIYTDGWIKDGDLNTGHGKTVEPLPFHEMTRYPYGPDEAYPDSKEYRDYRESYNTRRVGTERFRAAIRERKTVLDSSRFAKVGIHAE